jgi:aspartate aminotransferase
LNEKQFGADNVCDFSLGNPDIPPPPCAADALHGLAERVAQPFGMGYCPNAALPEFREALAAHLSVQQQTAVQAAQVVVTCGALARYLLFSVRAGPGDEVLCPAPYFVEYGSYCGIRRRAQGRAVAAARFPAGCRGDRSGGDRTYARTADQFAE